MDFIGPLPLDGGFDCLLTLTDRLGADIRLVPCTMSQTVDDLAHLFFTRWYCKNGLPLELISDRDKLFMSKFWRALHKLTGLKLKLSTVYHPQTDGASERTNKTVNQCLRFHVEHNQKGWVKALPLIRFNIMNTINKSTGFSGFQCRWASPLKFYLPYFLIDNGEIAAMEIINKLHEDTLEAQDNLTRAKISQSAQANKSRTLTFPFKVGD
jgi:hypothetical protein